MLDSFFVLLQNLPFGLLLAALLLDAFIVSKNRREVEPAVLWLLFCSICASGVVVVVTLGVIGRLADLHQLRIEEPLLGLGVDVSRGMVEPACFSLESLSLCSDPLCVLIRLEVQLVCDLLSTLQQ